MEFLLISIFANLYQLHSFLRREREMRDLKGQPIDLAYEVCNLQPSREGALPKNEEPKSVLNIDQHEYLKFITPKMLLLKS